MFQMFDATMIKKWVGMVWKCDPFYSFVISCMVWCKWTNVVSKEAIEFNACTTIICRGKILIHGSNPTYVNDPFITIIHKTIILRIRTIGNMFGVYKHGGQPTMIRSIPCFTILNDILLGNIHDHQNNHNWCLQRFLAWPTHMCKMHI